MHTCSTPSLDDSRKQARSSQSQPNASQSAKISQSTKGVSLLQLANIHMESQVGSVSTDLAKTKSNTKLPSLGDLIKSSTKQDKSQESSKLPTQSHIFLPNWPKTSTSHKSQDEGHPATNFSLADLAKMHSSKSVEVIPKTLSTLLSEATSKSTQHSKVDEQSRKAAAVSQQITFQSSQCNAPLFRSVISRTWNKDQLHMSAAVHKCIQQKLLKSYRAQFLLLFDFSSLSPDDLIMEHQKKGFK